MSERAAATMQRAPEPDTAHVPAPVREAFAGRGRPLDAGVRGAMEGRLGHDFSHVRVHTDDRAVATARALGASAYALGSDVMFDAGRYAPYTAAGRTLLAHELAHVVQQRTPSGGAPGAAHEANADALASGHAEAPAASAVGVARNGPNAPLPAVSAAELMDRLVLAVRGFAGSPSGTAHLALEGEGAALGTGYQTYAAVQIIDRQGDQILTSIGAYLGGGGAHAEAGAIAALRRALPVGANLEGCRIMVVVDQAPCTGCATALDSFALEVGAESMQVLVPSRPRLVGTGLAGPKTSARTSMMEGREAAPRELYTRNYPPRAPGTGGTGAPQTGGGATTTEPQAHPQTGGGTTTAEPQTGTTGGGATTAQPQTGTTGGGGTAGPSETHVQVETNVRVVASSQQPGGTTISEVEVIFGSGLNEVNAAAPGGASVPGRILLRITQNADGTLAAAESLTGEPAAVAKALAQQILSAGSQAATGEATGVAGGVASGESGGTTGGAASGEAGGLEGGAAGGGSRAASLLFRGVRWGGAAAFVVITGYQLITATPRQRPRVLAQAGGGFVAGAAGSYLVCNLFLDLETAGGGIIICGLLVGGAAGYAGSSAAGAAYDASLSDLDRALNDLEARPENVRRLFYAMVLESGGGGLPIDARFVQRFMAVVPGNLTDAELYQVAGRLRDIVPGGTLDDVINSLRTAIRALPTRALSVTTIVPQLVPPTTGTGADAGTDLTNQLFGPYHTGIPIGPRGRITIFPGPGGQGTAVVPPTTSTTTTLPNASPNLLQFNLFP